MYETFYGFTEKPFNLTPDPKYLYLSPRHTEAFAHLEFGRRERGGFSVITGEVGTGKTTLARYFLSRLEGHTATAVVLYPAVTAAELLRTILEDLHVPVAGTTLKDHVDALHRFLLTAREEKRDVVLLIDEAQDLSAEVLEQIRLISNLETDTEKLIQIVLMGQSELHEMLSRRELRQLAQRVTARYHLGPLNRPEVSEYIRHRLVIAGGEGKVTFTPGALSAVHNLSRGIPRLVNLICDRALLAGYVRSTRTIDREMVSRAAFEVRGNAGRRTPGLWYGLAGLGILAGAAGVYTLRPATRPMPAPAAVPAIAAPTAPAAPAPAAVDAAAAQRATPSSLEPILLSLERDTSFGRAFATIQARWGQPGLVQTPLRTHMDQVRRLDLPVILEMFHPARRDTCFVALLGIDGDDALLASEGDAPLRARLSEVDRLWTRQAVFVWKDFESLAEERGPRLAAWAGDQLQKLGYPAQTTGLPAAVSRFQRETDLAPDGILGQRTLMALYSRAAYARPRLGGGVS